MRNSRLIGTNFESARLNGADLTDADAAGARFLNADLRGATMLCANIIEAKFGGAMFDAATVWPSDFNPIARGARSVSGP